MDSKMSLFKILTAALFSIAAQAAAADEIQGIVQDSLGRPIAGAALSLKTVTANVIHQTQSGADGRFSFGNIAQGT